MPVDERFVVHAVEVRLGYLLAHHDEFPYRSERVLVDRAGEFLEQRRVHEQEFVARVLDDELDVFVGQQRIDGVELPARVGHGEVRLEVAVVVPAEGSDAGVVADTALVEGVRQSGDALAELRILVALDAVVGARDDLDVGIHSLCAPQERSKGLVAASGHTHPYGRQLMILPHGNYSHAPGGESITST